LVAIGQFQSVEQRSLRREPLRFLEGCQRGATAARVPRKLWVSSLGTSPGVGQWCFQSGQLVARSNDLLHQCGDLSALDLGSDHDPGDFAIEEPADLLSQGEW
jgi:hypothetical protein